MKVLLLISSIVLLASSTPPVETDYKKVFGDKYSWAVNWLAQNEPLINEYAEAFKIPARELKAIVFPELIRYNSVFNALETESLKFLYVMEGKDYADFSVGFFQMKPSFGEMVENDARDLLPQKYLLESGWSTRETENQASRRARVNRLSSVRQQLIYLAAFYKICDRRFKARTFQTPEEKLRLFATCYNAGYHRSYKSLMSFTTKKNFFSYNYSSVSIYYYLHEK